MSNVAQVSDTFISILLDCSPGSHREDEPEQVITTGEHNGLE